MLTVVAGVGRCCDQPHSGTGIGAASHQDTAFHAPDWFVDILRPLGCFVPVEMPFHDGEWMVRIAEQCLYPTRYQGRPGALRSVALRVSRELGVDSLVVTRFSVFV